MNLLICSFGSHGDINPYLALGRELIALGHDVTLGTSTLYRDYILEHGLSFTPVRPEDFVDDIALVERAIHQRKGPKTLIARIVAPTVRDMYEDLLEPASKADVLVSHVLSFAVPVVAEKLGKPWVSTVLSPIIFLSAHDPPVFAPAPVVAKLCRFGPQWNRILFRFPKWWSRNWTRPVKDLRRELGLSTKADPLWEGQHSPHLVLAMFSERFGPRQPDWPKNVEVTGFPFLDNPDAPLAAEIEAFYEEDEPPLVFTLGSAAVRIAGDFYKVAAEAADRLHRRAVLVAGAQTASLQEFLPKSMVAVEWAAFPALFARAAAVIHPGGVGTTAQALRAGVPQLVIPFAHDQFDNAARVRRLGCGLYLHRSHLSAKRLAGSLEKLLADEAIRTTAMKESAFIREERGAATAAEVLVERMSAVMARVG